MLSNYYKIEFFFGTGLTQDRQPIDKEIVGRSLQIIKATVNNLFGGCTLIEAVGSWTDPNDGYIYKEPSRLLFTVVKIPVTEVPNLIDLEKQYYGEIQEITELIRTTLDQKSVLVTTSIVRGNFS